MNIVQVSRVKFENHNL